MKKKAMLLICVIVLTIGAGWCYSIWRNTPQKTVERFLGAIQSGKLSKAESMTLTGTGLTADNRRVKKLYKAMHKTMRFVVADVLEENETARVVVSVTMVDMETLLADTSLSLLDQSLRSMRSGQGRYYKQLLARIRSGEEATATTTATVLLIKDNNMWQVDVEQSTKLVTAITGGIGIL